MHIILHTEQHSTLCTLKLCTNNSDTANDHIYVTGLGQASTCDATAAVFLYSTEDSLTPSYL